jgi:hypothetical protein
MKGTGEANQDITSLKARIHVIAMMALPKLQAS